MLKQTVQSLDKLPELACPDNQTVFSLTLHPEYLAKSYFPENLLQTIGLRSVGSRLTEIEPRQLSRGRKPIIAPALEIFVAGYLDRIHSWLDELPNWHEGIRGFDELTRIENVRALNVAERTRLTVGNHGHPGVFEMVLHAQASSNDQFVISGFQQYLESLEVDHDLNRRFYAGGLCFLRIEAESATIPDIGEFSFLRVVRPMPKLRMLPAKQASATPTRRVNLPQEASVDPKIRVAVFDGGLPENSPLEQWTDVFTYDDIGETADECLEHGETVTSALLFGSLPIDGDCPVPFADVHHYQVLGKSALEQPFELYEVLERIREVLDTGQYPFANLSFGPALPVEDHDVHAWTAVLDEYLSTGLTLATIAVGNTGEDSDDVVFDAKRIQVPSDCVNGLSIGAADRSGVDWSRAPYSSIGPGRSPGVIKPDLLAFGGSEHEDFWVVSSSKSGHAIAIEGTSYAAPSALRVALGVRSVFGEKIQPLALKALLVHSASSSAHARNEVGWGRVAGDIADLVSCPQGVARILYQGTLVPSRYLRALIPLPEATLDGMVRITATFCYVTPVDPEHPASYTRSGLGISFRPHDEAFQDDDSLHAKTASFFRSGDFDTEAELRRDAHQWETCLHSTQSKRGTSLRNPCFDIHYNARLAGRATQSAERIPYALVITIEARRHLDLYELIRNRYRNVLRPIEPIIHLPLRT